MRKTLLSIVAILLVIFFVVLTYALFPTHTRDITADATTSVTEPVLIEKGRYLAIAGDCIACHTAPHGGQLFAGGRAIESPIGAIYTTNITPDRDTGIGNYTLQEFNRAVRYGITPDGGTLYPAHPYPSYAHVNDDDVRALYAYLEHGVTAVNHANRATDIPWPLSIRWPLAIWRKVFAPWPDDVVFNPKRYSDPVVARGAYLVEGLGHCGACHTDRALTMQEKSLDASSTDYLAGGQVVDGWGAVNLRGNMASGLGSWSQDDIITLLRSGRNPGQTVVGQSMMDVIENSTQHFTDEDLKAVAAYLKTLSPAQGDMATFKADPATAKALAAGDIPGSRGSQLYADNCAACHRTDGKGDVGVFPRVAGNSTVLDNDPTTTIRLIIQGSSLPNLVSAPSPLGMPGFGNRMSDQEVAQLTTFIRQAWGNHASSVTAEQVAKVRKTPDPARVVTPK